MEDAVTLVARTRFGVSGPVGTASESLLGWILKFGEENKRLRTIAESFVDWLINHSPPWTDYCAFMSGCLIVLDKQP